MKTNIIIPHSKELQYEIKRDAKQQMFDRMIKHQIKVISQNMREGRDRHVLWIFSDKENYTTTLEKTWYAEFALEAKRIFEEKGYIVKGILIHW